MFHNKVVVRTGFGMYYDRGELFSYFSPGYAIGTVTGGPFGVNQQLPFVTAQMLSNGTQYLYEATSRPAAAAGQRSGPARHAIDGQSRRIPTAHVQTPAPTNPKASDLNKYLPNLAAIEDYGQPISLGVYDRTNKLPYTYNYTLDIQWQPRNDLAIELGYVGNLGRHQVIPVPFNQPGIANPTTPIHGEIYSYGYTVSTSMSPATSSHQSSERPALPTRLRGRQRRPSRSLHRLRCRVDLTTRPQASMPTTRSPRT